MRCSFYSICLLFCLHSFTGLGQSDHVFWNYDISHGLPTNSIYHVFVDSKDRVWFGSDKGVTKYDGNAFTTYTVKDGLPDNTVIRCYEDSRGKIWFQHIDRLPSYYKDGELKRLDQFNSEFQVSSMTNFVEYENDMIIGGLNGFISIDSIDRVTKYKTEKPQTSLFIEDNTFYVSGHSLEIQSLAKTRQKLKFKFLKYESSIVAEILSPFGNEALFRSIDLMKMVAKRVIDPKKLIDLQNQTGKIYNIEFLKTRAFVASEKGLFEYTLINGSFKYKSTLIENLPIAGIAFDTEGNIWANSIETGLYFFSNKKNEFVAYPNAKRLLKIRVLNDEILAFGESHFFYNFQKNGFKIKTFTNYQGRNNFLINDYYKNDKYEIFVLDKGIEIVDLKSLKTFKLFPYSASKGIFPNPFDENEFYVAGLNSVFHLKMDSVGIELKENLFLNKGRVNSIAIDKKRIIIGTRRGLFIKKENKLIPFHANTFEKSRINSLYRIKNKIIIGTGDKGLYIEENDKLKHFSELDGLLSNYVYHIYNSETRNCFWVHSDLGIQQFEIVGDKIIEKHRMDLRSSFKIDEISDILERNGELILALNTGFRVIQIDDFKQNTDLSIFLEKVILGKEIIDLNKIKNLSSKDQNFSFSVIAVNHSSHPLSYFYRLNNGDWIKNETSQFIFSSLSPGEYVFDVKITSPFHKTAYIKSIALTVEKEWYQKSYVILLAFILSLFVLALIIRWQINKVQNRKQRFLSNELLALQSQMNPHFTFNSLNSIQSFLSTNDKRSAQIYLADFAILMRKILDQAKISLISIEEEVDFLSQYLNLEKRRLNNSFEFNISIEEGLNQQEQAIPTLMLQPFVENAIWHGVAALDYPGKIDVTFSQDDINIVCEIIDNGPGLSESKSKNPYHKSTGISNCNERMSLFKELHKKEMSVVILDRKENKTTGVCVRLTIPKISINK